MNTIESIQAVINTLNFISVRGVEDMNRMLGSIQTLANVKAELAKSTEGVSEDGSEH